MPRLTDLPIIPCSLSEDRQNLIEDYAEALKRIAPTIAPEGSASRLFGTVASSAALWRDFAGRAPLPCPRSVSSLPPYSIG